MRLCITGGGTGGHLMIAEALLESALNHGHEVIFIGSTYGQDQKYFLGSEKFSNVYFLETTGVVNQKGLGKIKALFKIFKAFFTSRKILKKHNIDALYSVGGFSAAPASFAAISKSIPFFIHEQNAVAGKLNSILKPYAKRFVSAYDKNLELNSYPVKEIFFKNARIRDELKTIIFLGGSHGARAINDLAIELTGLLNSNNIKIIHQAGESDYERVKDAYEELGVEVELYSFSKDLASLISRADFAISRAGASTLWELTANGCPALYIPYPYAAGDHQFYNAEFIVKNNLGWCERESNNLKQKVEDILKKPLLQEKSQKLLSMANSDAANMMITDVESFLK
jgi:UDP-N-acetylglucosamine--N-acetylmuramyl-(pentapeptide) pyrophosphoryl-undecaprenol N-acetylglucosamine transferase